MIDFKKNYQLFCFLSIFIFAFIFRFILIIIHPEIYSWDAFRRIWNYEYLFVRHWLPFLQLLIFTYFKVSSSLIGLRVILALIAGLTCGSCYLLGQKLFNKEVGLIWALLMSVFPLFVKYSIVPYQEGIFLFLIIIGLFLYLSERTAHLYLSAFAISLACLTRYEGWIICGIILIDLTLKNFKKRKVGYYFLIISFSGGLILWGAIATLTKIEWVMGSPLDNSHVINNKIFLIYNFKTLVKHILSKGTAFIKNIFFLMGIPAVCMMAGLYSLFKERFVFKIQLAVFVLSLIALCILRSLGGVLTDRMMVFPIVFLLIPLAVFFQKFWEIAQKRRPGVPWGTIIAVFILILYAPKAAIFVQNASNRFRQEYNIAKYLEKIDTQAKILVYPRRSDNIWGESHIAAIIGNSTKLKINKNVYSFDMLPEKMKNNVTQFIEREDIKYILLYTNGKYHIKK
jgi:hypothetical protein